MFRITDYQDDFMELLFQFQDQILKSDLTLGQMVDNTKIITDRIGREFVIQVIEMLDKAYRESDVRKQTYTIQRRGMEKTLATMLGPIQYERTQFQDKRDDHYIYLTDRLLGIQPHQRVDNEVACTITQSAAYQSYRKTIKEFDFTGLHSPTTVKNYVKKVDSIRPEEHPVPHQKLKVETIYVEADEDHVAMQSGKNEEMRLVYCHEGAEKVCKGRKRLITPHYFSGWYKGQSEDLWYDVLGYLDEAYDLSESPRIVLRGDGAAWINHGARIIPNCEMQLDRYHLQKYIRKATSPIDGMFGRDNWYYDMLYEKIAKGDREGVIAFFDSTEGLPLIASQEEAINTSKKYLLRHWDAIQNSFKGDPGCSTEPHVSHVLSDRLSSRPMGWSTKGAENIAGMRTFELNGGDLKQYLRARKEKNEAENRVAKLEKRVVKKAMNIYPVKEGSILYPTRNFESFKL